ncbi:XRE family transcriptional regulator [Cellulomonas denverensis]|nr:XRE family transcriptional regulator [Cellulomonas denverensis]GIG27083.1 transcriptional regulator [Cellulomonas denverensis]
MSAHAEARLSPSRIRLARERRGLTKVALAAELGVTARVLQTYENEGAPGARADDLAVALEVTPRFFHLPDRDAITPEQGFFRALRRASAAQLGRARAAAGIGFEIYEWVTARYELPELVLPDVDAATPELAAATVRAVWGRGDERLPNLVQLSEAHGVRVMSLPSDAEAVDAFSVWHAGLPYVFLSRSKSPERSRFDLAHELGHLVMHSGARAGVEVEREADQFAAALLMPRDGLSARAGREPAVPEILRLRSHYRVSAMAMTRRLHAIGKLTEWSYRQNCVQLSRQGFRVGEPDGIEPERSRVFATVFAALRDQGVTAQDVAAELGITARELHLMTLGHAPAPIEGGAERTERPSGAHLRLVR